MRKALTAWVTTTNCGPRGRESARARAARAPKPLNAPVTKPIGFTALEDVTEAAAVILMEGPEKHSGKAYWFSADILDPQQVAETLTAATGHKFTAAVRDHERFVKEMAMPPGSTFEPAYAKGGIELFREVEHRRMACIGSVADYIKSSVSRAVAAGLGKAARQ